MAMVLNPLVGILRQGLKASGHTQAQLFEEYRRRGGLAKQPNTMGGWLRGASDIPSRQLAIIVAILDDWLEEEGKEPLPIVFPSEVLVGQDEANPDNAILYCRLTPFHQGFRGLPRTNRSTKLHFASRRPCSV